jgi:hypothetical protein
MAAINRNNVKVYICNAGTAPSLLVASDVISGEIKSYSKSGGAVEVSSDPVFGGFVDLEKPREQIEISMDVIPSIGSNANFWDALIYSNETVATKTNIYTLNNGGTGATVPGDKMITIQALSGTNYKTVAFNNCNVTVFDFEHNADDNRTGKITFKFSPTTETGVSNFMTAASAATALPAWTSLASSL